MENTLDDIIHKISHKPKERLTIFRHLKAGQKREVILRLSKHLRQEIIFKLHEKEIREILELLDPDEATDLLQLLPSKKRKRIIKKLNKKLKENISLLLKFDPETAAGLMSIDYILVEADDTIASVANRAKVHEKRTGKFPAILIIKNGCLSGYLPAFQLGLRQPNEKIAKYYKKIHTVKYNADLKKVLDVFRQYRHSKVVVLGDTGNILGIVYSDDILRALQEKEASSLYNFAGVHKEESVYDSIKRKVSFRYKWLIINLGTAFLAAFTVNLFETTISKYVLLAVYMPIVAGMGGNAATQTMAVLVRGIALKQINLKTMWRTLKNEVGAGFINGLINGLIIVTIVFLKDHNPTIALILALSMIINLMVAGFFGTITPLLMEKLGKDPASSATIFITTATDVLGFFTFLGLATLILK